MRTSEIRQMPLDELKQTLVELKEELFNLRFQASTAQLENPSRIRQVRRGIAKCLTILKEKDITGKNYESS